MTDADSWIDRIMAEATGARFRKCALQVNPFVYGVKHSKPSGCANEDEYNKRIVEALSLGGIEVIGVTDHFAIQDSKSLIVAAEAKQITVFPGFEAETKDGIHILCLFEPGTASERVQAAIHECGIHSLDIPDLRSKYDCEELLLEVKKWGAIAVAAHVIQEKGLLRAMQGGRSATALWKNENLQACSISGKLDETPPEFLPILKNTTPEYKRTRPIAIINAQDVSSPDDVSKTGAITDIKMSALSVEGLRQAFIDPETRVRRYDQQPDKPHQEILAIRWQGGFLDGLELRFNANLNVLIGGRGTGKSTVVESIRYVLGIQPIGEEARRSHESLIRDVLKEATVVSVLVRTHTPSLQDYCVERIVPNPPQVRELDGSVSALSPRDLMPGVEIYGQHEIAEMVRDRRKLTGLLRRFAPDETALLSRKQQLQVDLKRSRTRLVELRAELTQLDERLSALPGLRETLKHYKTAGIEEKLKDQALLIREERILTTARERLEPLNEVLRDLEEIQEIDVSFITPSALKDLPAATTLQSLRSTIQKLSKSITAAAGAIRSAIATAESEIAEVEDKWTSGKVTRQAALEKALREMQKSSGTTDPASFGQLHKKITTLEPLQDRRALVRRDLEKLEKERIQLLASWEEAKAEHYRLLATAAKKLSRAVEWRVRLSVEQPGDREPLLRLLQEDLGGTVRPIYDRVTARDTFSLPAFVAACRGGSAALKEAFGLTNAQADRLSTANEQLFLKIEELDFVYPTRLELNLADEGQAPEWRNLEQLSKGQKATAVLLLLLFESSSPLIVDQPEDDLDNRFISDGIVPKIRDGKQRRQFIFATHNANIPVLGDAEMIAALEAKGEPGEEFAAQASVAEDGVGSIDDPKVCKLVGEILEGGEAAFETRRMKYGY